MKTKYYLTAMCLPLAFAACTNEEIETIDNGLAGREVVKMALSANYGTDGAESRMVNNNGTFLWDNTDVLGAAMLNGTGQGVFSNNRFGNTLTEPSDAADFTTQSTTIAGEYTFYYPYSEDVTKNPNGGIIYSLPAVQEYDPTGEKMMENNFMVAPRITVDGKEPGTLTLPITMRSIYSYGLLNLRLSDNVISNYSTVTDLNIQKIIIEYASNVETDGRIDLSVLPKANITTGYLTGIQTGVVEGYPSLKDKDLAEIRAALLAEADAVLVGTSTVYANGDVLNLTTVRDSKTTNKINKVVISCVSEQYPNGVALSKGGEFSTRVLLPTTANAGTADNTKITVYTNKGIAEVAGSALAGGVMKANHTVNLANVNRTGEATALYINGTLNTSSMSVEAISEADFIASMRQYAGMNEPQINVSINGFNLTPNAIAAIPTTAKVTFTSDVTFEGDMTLKNMSFASKNVTFKSGTIVLESILTSGDATSYTIKKDADVTFKALTTSNSSVVTIDGGKLTVEKYNASNAAVMQYVGSISVVNGGSLVVNTPLTATATITKGSLENNSTISNLTVEVNGYAENNGSITTLNNSGSVDNYGTIVGGTNSGVINQKLETSKITLSKNNAKVYTVAYSQTTVTENLGDIIFVENARVSADKNVAYEVPADFKASDMIGLVPAITKLIFNQDFTYGYEKDAEGKAVNNYHEMTNTKVVSMEFKGNLTLADNWTLNANTSISFTAAKANLTGIQKKLEGTGLTLSAGVNKIGNNPAVPTQLYIGNKLTIETLVDVVLNGGATVWNEGTVKGTPNVSQPNGWDGAAIGGSIVKDETSLAEALKDNSVEVIALNGEIALEKPLAISKNVTIKGGTISGKAVTVSSSAEVTFDGVTFKDADSGDADADASSIYYSAGTKKITIKNCTFEGFQWDAIQLTNLTNTAEVEITGNTFKTPEAENALKDGSYIHIANKDEFTGKIKIVGNTFQTRGGMQDYPIKIYGVSTFGNITVGKNTVNDEWNASLPYVFVHHNNKENKTYAIEKLFNAFKGNEEVILNTINW